MKILSRALFASLVLACSGPAMVGCGHEVESPAVTASPPEPEGQKGPADPDLVCVEQLTTTITLSGDGFTPFPSKTLEGPTQLLLPTVTLTRTTAIDGTPAAGTFVVPDDVANLPASHVHWTSQQQMAFDVSPDEKLDPGLYDINVMNRDGVHSASFPGAFAGVPRPTLTAVAADLSCDAQTDQTFKLTGAGLLQVGDKLPTVHVNGKDFPVQALTDCKPVPGAHFAKTQTCSTATFVVPTGSFEPGVVKVTLTNPAPAACVSTDEIAVTIVPPPSVTSIVPDLVCDAQGDVSVTINGTGSVQVGATMPIVKLGEQAFNGTAVGGCSPVPGAFAEGAVTTCTSVTISMKQGTMPAGDFAVVVTNPPPADCHSTEVLTEHVEPPPTITTIAADLICDAQGDQAMVLTGSFLRAGALPEVKVGASTFTPTSIENCVTVTGKFTESPVQRCTTLKFTIPTGTFAESDYPVIVTNPAPAPCSSTDTINLHVSPPPAITGVAQAEICDAEGSASVTIQGSGFLQVGAALPTVTINAVNYAATSTGGCTTIAQTFAEGQARECTSVVISVPQGALGAGSYPISIKNPAPADCHVDSAINLVVNPPPTVSASTPAAICAGGGVLHITGTGFIETPTVTLHDPAGLQPDVPSVAPTHATLSTHIDATIPAGGNVGTTYDVVVQNPDSCTDQTPPPHKTVQVTPGPVLYFADPEIVYSGISTRVTLYTTTASGATSVTITPSGGAGAVTDLTPSLVQVTPTKVQVTIPKSLAAGKYDILLTDTTGCPAILQAGITITNTLTLTLKSIVPPFGWTNTNTDVTIYRDTAAAAPANKPFVATPRVFLNPHTPSANDVAIQLTATSMTDAATLTSVVPKGSPANQYDLIVVNPDGAVGVLGVGGAAAFTITNAASPPPTITSVTPSSIVTASGQVISVAGTNFRASSLGISPTSGCADVNGNSVARVPTIVSGAVASCPNCTQTATLNAGAPTGMLAGDSCVLRLTNSDGTFAEYSAIGITNSSLNLSAPRAGNLMTVPRRALVGAAANATAASRFVYAIGGDDGTAAGILAPYSTVEAAPVDIYGTVKTWALQPYGLGAVGRSFAAKAQVGRYIYLCGGTDGVNYLASCKRGMVLDPLESPHVDVSDLQVGLTGLNAGYWYYRVAATYAADDLDNPSGESLPSDEIVVKTPGLIKFKVKIVLSWTAPVDSLNAPLPKVSGYRVYRTPVANGKSGDEVLIGTVGAGVLTFTDDGSAVPGAAKPLPPGSTGQWADLAPMSIGRKGLAMAYGFDPVLSTRFYVYSFFGLKDGTATGALGSYEFMKVDIGLNGHQTVVTAPTTWTAGANGTGVGHERWQAGAWVVDSTVTATVTAPNTWIYIGGGINAAGNNETRVDAGKVAAGGDLGVFVQPNNFGVGLAGYGVCAANEQLFTFGGVNHAPDKHAKSAKLSGAPQPNLANWNDEGLQTIDPLYLEGSAVQSAFIFLLGGETAAGPPIVATRATETVLW